MTTRLFSTVIFYNNINYYCICYKINIKLSGKSYVTCGYSHINLSCILHVFIKVLLKINCYKCVKNILIGMQIMLSL